MAMVAQSPARSPITPPIGWKGGGAEHVPRSSFMGMFSKRSSRSTSPIPGPHSPGGAASVHLRLEIRRGAKVCLTSNWEGLKACFAEVDYEPHAGMKAMCGREFTVVCMALPSLGVDIMALPSPSGERFYFPITAVAAVVREAPTPSPGHRPEEVFYIDTEHDFVDGAAYELESLPIALQGRPLAEIISHCAHQCDEYDAHGFFYQQEAVVPAAQISGAVIGYFKAIHDMKGRRGGLVSQSVSQPVHQPAGEAFGSDGQSIESVGRSVSQSVSRSVADGT